MQPPLYHIVRAAEYDKACVPQILEFHVSHDSEWHVSYLAH